jgi:hypothetical protein
VKLPDMRKTTIIIDCTWNHGYTTVTGDGEMIHWTPEELAEMAESDKKIDAEPAPDGCADSFALSAEKSQYEKYREKYRKYYMSHKEQNNLKSKKWRETHKKQYKQIQHAWYLANKQRILLKHKAYRQKKKAAKLLAQSNGTKKII